MSREIKFRAWDGEKIDHEPTFGETSFGGSYVNSFNNDFQKRIFMQYTGLLDKHGKEIYEGDIIQIWAISTEVIQKAYKFKRPIIVKWEKMRWNLREDKNYEIIGNVYEGLHSGEKFYEHPELLPSPPKDS